MPSSPRSDGKYNHQAEYFLCSVKQRNLPEFLDALKKEKKRHAEPKADNITALGANERHKKAFRIDLDELFYFINSYNSIRDGGYFYLNRLKKIIMEQIEKDYEEMGMTLKDLELSYMDKQDEMYEDVYMKKQQQQQQ